MKAYYDKRRIGYIKPVKTDRIPQRFISVDTETYDNLIAPKTHEFPFRLGVAITVILNPDGTVKERETLRFKDVQDFIDLMLRVFPKNKVSYVVGHNIGFDLRVMGLFYRLAELDTSSTPPIINERVFIWSVKFEKRTIKFIDTANFAVHSVAQIGRDLGFPKGEVDFKTVSEEDLFDYCERDTDIVATFMQEYIRFIAVNTLGEFKVTLASQSLTAWKRRFMTERIFIHKIDEVIALEREAYHGGRVEVFRKFKSDDTLYWYLDVNSMYPYMMRNLVLPAKFRAYTEITNVKKLSEVIQNLYCIADVTLVTNVPAYSMLREGKLVFGIGRMRVTLHDCELRYALEHNHIEKVHSCAMYEKAVLFDKYVDFFYDVKTQASITHNSSWRFIAKIFLNSLYGKFGQTEVNRVIVGTDDYNVINRTHGVVQETGKHYNEIHWLGTIYREEKGGECPHSSPAIAGAITAEARMLLWRYIEIAGRDNVVYCDTDSIICNTDGIEPLLKYIDDNTLGLLKVEDTSYQVNIRGCKDYSFSHHDKIKGVPSNAKSLSDNKWSYLQFQGLLSWFNAGHDTPPLAYDREKERRGTYNKGIVLASGDIRPFIIDFVD